MGASGLQTRRTPAASSAAPDTGLPLDGRLGLSVPYEWWPTAALLKSYEAAGFAFVQLHSPPPSVLADARTSRRHARALAASLETTGLRAVLHAPATMRLATRDDARAFEAMLAYAAEISAEQVVYHGLAYPEVPGSDVAVKREARALATAARLAERLAITIAVENLAPLYPGPETLSASPPSVRGLVRAIGSERVRMCLDIGHAHVVADSRHTWVEKLCEPVLDTVSLIHVHDNLGARRHRSGAELGVDPLRLDLHLAPGSGTLPFHRLAPLLAAHPAPLVLEVHPPYRPRASELAAATRRLLAGRGQASP